jgi:hypothetical protein
MKLTPKTAQTIADAYGHNEIEYALEEVSRRQGGICAALNEDARRDLILTLGRSRRDSYARSFWRRMGGDTSRPWSADYRKMLSEVFRTVASQ